MPVNARTESAPIVWVPWKPPRTWLIVVGSVSWDQLSLATPAVDVLAHHVARDAGEDPQQRLDVLHGQVGLSCHVADSNALGSREVLANLPANEDHRPLGNHHLAKVVVETLLGISVLGIELADSLVCHLGPHRIRLRR